MSPPPPPLSPRLRRHHPRVLILHTIFSSSSSNSALLLAAVISLVLVLLFVTLLHLYAKCFLSTTTATISSHATDPSLDLPPPSMGKGGGGGGLDVSTIASIPLFTYDNHDKVGGKDDDRSSLESCVFCLSAFEDGDVGRTLPTCAHRAFHVGCIDMWLQAHSTCPVCRAPVTLPPDQSSSASGESEDVVVEVAMGANENGAMTDDESESGLSAAAQLTPLGCSLRRILSWNGSEMKIYLSSSSTNSDSLTN